MLRPPVPQHIFICNIDICSSFPFAEMLELHNKHRGVGTILGVKVRLFNLNFQFNGGEDLLFSAIFLLFFFADEPPKVKKETATRYGCIVSDPETSQVLHYVEKPESWISNTVNGGVYSECGVVPVFLCLVL